MDTSKLNNELIATKDDEKYTIATVVKVDSIAWFDRMRDGVEQFNADTGREGTQRRRSRKPRIPRAK
ncbi:hypothetical protein ACFPOD_17870 [Nitratireductor kimnyeongensis]|uniref:Uncharacterized protein n=1 Tax=Nitratireductor kimnyeongensis TaxID=430679 RepID=A0ABW0TEA9_9HYPH|nr:hypothetical protein [Nitratireductor kimnyeongensis]